MYILPVLPSRCASRNLSCSMPVGRKSDEDCFESIRAGVDALSAGAKMFLNSAEFYSSNWSTENLKLLSRFYGKYPDYAEKSFLSVKGGIPGQQPDCSYGLDRLFV
ncbi:hypothetical protein DFH07DRAFT_804334 [Mycena maculata]|uniref:NADP-dependent oxidoreductase domain-containing protein n=1 Tax=Mycena maculata TaxID=230809 RepID=A0AAD7JWN2_9AGAR|nr:hypothetical protein DFH07DRAFT_804334 [Mycena maculata]